MTEEDIDIDKLEQEIYDYLSNRDPGDENDYKGDSSPPNSFVPNPKKPKSPHRGDGLKLPEVVEEDLVVAECVLA